MTTIVTQNDTLVTVVDEVITITLTASLPLTAAQLAALNAANNPSTSNPFATLSDVTSQLAEYVGSFTIGLSRVGSLAYIS